MTPRRPPDLLRKSHAHSEGKVRAKDKSTLREALSASIDEIATDPALLIDLDGVVYRGDEAVPGAAAAVAWLEQHNVRHLFVTNTTSRPRESLVEKLAGLGLSVAPEAILTPAEAAAAWLADRGCRRLFLLVPAATCAAFGAFSVVGAGLGARGVSAADDGAHAEAERRSDERVDAVVIGRLGASTC